jgi:hypothetical protein
MPARRKKARADSREAVTSFADFRIASISFCTWTFVSRLVVFTVAMIE